MILDPDPVAAVNYLEWLERLGGWAVVVWIVAYFMKEARAERVAHEKEIEALVDTWSEVVETFKTFETEERKTHEEILKVLEKNVS